MFIEVKYLISELEKGQGVWTLPGKFELVTFTWSGDQTSKLVPHPSTAN